MENKRKRPEFATIANPDQEEAMGIALKMSGDDAKGRGKRLPRTSLRYTLLHFRQGCPFILAVNS